jgi:hypothetical protein
MQVQIYHAGAESRTHHIGADSKTRKILVATVLTNMRAHVQLDSRLALTVLSKARPRTASIRQDSTGWTRPVCPLSRLLDDKVATSSPMSGLVDW